jgi:hypothetical protein
LLRALSSPFVFVHVDRRTEIEPFLDAAAPHVEFAEDRSAVSSRDWTAVAATLGLMRQAFETRQDWDYLVLLSGTHYPLRDSSYIREFFARHGDSEFLQIRRIPNPRTPIDHLTTFAFRPRRNLLTALPALLQSRVRSSIMARDYEAALQGWTPFAGDRWWALTGAACRHVLQTVELDRSRVAFLREAHHPGEMLFQMVIGNSSRAPQVRGSLSHPDWINHGLPTDTITDQQIARLAAQRCVAQGEDARMGEILFASGFPDDSEHLTALVQETLWKMKPVASGRNAAQRLDWNSGPCAEPT